MGCAGWEPASRRWWVALSPRRFPSKFVRACRCTPPCSARTRFWRREKRKGGECQFRWHNAVTGPGRKKRASMTENDRAQIMMLETMADVGAVEPARQMLFEIDCRGKVSRMLSYSTDKSFGN